MSLTAEERMIERISRRRGESNNPLFVEKIQVAWDKLRPQTKDFSDIYSQKEMLADKEEIEEIKKQFEAKGETAIVGEYVIMEGIYELQWLAEEVEVIPTNEFDDIKHGIDFVLRFEEAEDKYKYLGVDVTTSIDRTVIEDKRDRILKFLRKGELGKVKYFEDPAAEIKGSIELPRIAVVLSPKEAIKMQEIMLKIKEHEKITPTEEKEINKVKNDVEREVVSQIEKIIIHVEGLIRKEKQPSRYKKDEEKINKYERFLQSYQDILSRIRKEALH